jgi:hypothetical protein
MIRAASLSLTPARPLSLRQQALLKSYLDAEIKALSVLKDFVTKRTKLEKE